MASQKGIYGEIVFSKADLSICQFQTLNSTFVLPDSFSLIPIAGDNLQCGPNVVKYYLADFKTDPLPELEPEELIALMYIAGYRGNIFVLHVVDKTLVDLFCSLKLSEDNAFIILSNAHYDVLLPEGDLKFINDCKHQYFINPISLLNLKVKLNLNLVSLVCTENALDFNYVANLLESMKDSNEDFPDISIFINSVAQDCLNNYKRTMKLVENSQKSFKKITSFSEFCSPMVENSSSDEIDYDDEDEDEDEKDSSKSSKHSAESASDEETDKNSLKDENIIQDEDQNKDESTHPVIQDDEEQDGENQDQTNEKTDDNLETNVTVLNEASNKKPTNLTYDGDEPAFAEDRFSWFEDDDILIGHSSTCECYEHPADIDLFNSLNNADIFFDLVNGMLHVNNIMCRFNNAKLALKILSCIKHKDLECKYFDHITHFISIILKFRHDYAFYHIFATDTTDVPFSSVLPLNSNRTPDLIIVNEKYVQIYELTVVSDIQKGAYQKGVLNESGKYRNEVLELENMGFIVSYKTIIISAFGENMADIMSEYKVNPAMFNDITTLSTVMSRFFSDNLASAFFDKDTMLKFLKYKTVRLHKLCFELSDNSDIRYSFGTAKIKYAIRMRKMLPRLIQILTTKPDGKYLLVVFKNRRSFNFLLDESYGAEKTKLLQSFKKSYIPTEYLKIQDSTGVVSDMADHNYFLPKKVLQENLNTADVTGASNLLTVTLMLDFNYELHEPALNWLLKFDDVKESLISIPKWFQNPLQIGDYEERFVERIKLIAKNIQDQQLLSFSDKPHGWLDSDHLLINKPMNIPVVVKSIKLFDQKLALLNTLGQDGRIFKAKSCFLYPIIKVLAISKTEQQLSKELATVDLGVLTGLVLNQIAKIDKVKTQVEHDDVYNVKYRKLMKIQSEITGFVLDNLENFGQINDNEKYVELVAERKKSQKDLESHIRSTGISRAGGVKYITLGCGKNSANYQSWQAEMPHIKSKGSSAYKTGMFMNLSKEAIDSGYSKTVDYLFSSEKYLSFDVMDNFIAAESDVLFRLKQMYMKEINVIYNYVKTLNVFNISCFLSRMFRSIHYFSVCSLGRDHFMFDSFAPGCLLIVKGGNKLFKNNRSRWLRIFFPVSNQFSDFVYPEGGSYKKFSLNNEEYVATPWINFNETLILDGMFSAHKIANFYINSALSSTDEHSITIKKLHFHTMMMFHQRRKTEKTLHDMRYILMNCFSLYSDYENLIQSMAIECKDNIQSFIMRNLSENLKDFYISCDKFSTLTAKKVGLLFSQEALNVKHPISRVNISVLSDLSFAIYLTTLMSKAPVDNLSEQILDLKAVMESQDQFDSEVSSNDIGDFLSKSAVDLMDDNYEKKLFEKDFAFDPKICWLVGRFCGDYIKDRTNISTLENFLDNIMNEPFQKIANTSGLRGRHFDSDFFGKKGYYIVYKDSSQIKIDELINILDSNMLLFEKRKKILDLNITLIEKYLEFFDDDMMIQMVHKIQKGGPREIYVMTYPTKIKQQVLEKFFAKLSTFLPNEMISIASNKRMVWVHQRVHEHDPDVSQDLTKIFNTYDCKRWAPHCNTLKYFYFVSGMSHILPSKFVHIFIHFWDNYLNKKFVIRGKLYDSVINNQTFKNFMTKFEVVTKQRVDIKTQEKKDYVFLAFMTYVFSFAMGIFNYLSSLMHASNQLYLRYLIQKVPKNIGKNDFRGDMILIAHSDDSGGKTYCNNQNSLATMLYIHELTMKACNHMLSKKKSNISKVYFEITSILYFAGVFVPVLSKFSSLMSIAPTDGGYADDVLTVISKSIEMLTNGATFCQAYATQKICVDMIRKFYNLPTTQADYNLPYNCLGVPDSHPLMYLLAGSDYEDLKFIYLKPEIYNLTQRFLYSLNGNLYSEKLNPNYTNFNKYFKLFSGIIELINKCATGEQERKALKHIDNSTTMGNLTMFSQLIQQNKFVWSLDYQNKSRRIVRALWVSVSDCIPTYYGYTNYKKIRTLCHQLILSIVHKEQVVDNNLSKYMPERFNNEKVIKQIEVFSDFNKKIYTATDDIGVLIKMLDSLKLRIDNVVPSNSNIRPVSVNLDIGLSPIGNDFNIDRILIEMFAPKFLPLMKDCYKNRGEVEMLKEYMPAEVCSDITLMQKVLKSFQQRTQRRFIMYSQMPRGKNMVKDYRAVMMLLSFNSLPNKQIKGLNLPLSNRLVLTGEYYLWGKEMELDNIIYDTYLMLSTFFNYENKQSGIYDKILSIDVKYGEDVLHLNIMLRQLASLEDRMSLLAKTLLRLMRSTILRLYTQGISIDLSDLNGCVYFLFSKEQMRTRDSWIGRGEVIIYWSHLKIKLIIDNDRVINMMISEMPNNFFDIITYIDLFLTENHYLRLTKCFERKSTHDKGLVYRIREKTYEYDYGTNATLYFPLDIADNIPDIYHFVKYNQLKLKTLRRIDILTDDPVKRIYFVPTKHISAMGLTHSFFVDSSRNKRIMEELGYKGLSIFDFITHRSYGVDITVKTEDLIQNCSSSEIYRLIYATSGFASDFKPNKPGAQGGFMHSLLKYKDENPNYEFNPDYTYMLPMIALGQVYTGSVLSQMYVDGKKMWEALTNDSKELLADDTRSLITKHRLTKRFAKEDVKNILSLWGPKLTEYSLSLYDIDNKQRVLDSLLYSLKYMPLVYIEEIYIDLHSVIFGILLSHNFKKKHLIDVRDGQFLIQTLVRYMISNSEFVTNNNNSYRIFMTLVLKSIFKDDKALKIFNEIIFKSVYPVLAVEYKLEDLKNLMEIIFTCTDIICLNIKGDKITDRAIAFRKYGTVMGDNVKKHFSRILKYTSAEVKKDFCFKNTTFFERKHYMLPLDLNLSTPISGFKEVKKDDDEDLYDEIEDLCYEISLGNNSEEYIDEKMEMLDKIKVDVAPNTKEIFSCYEPNSSAYAMTSAFSSKTIILLEGSFCEINKNFRRGNIKSGFITPRTAALNGLTEMFWPVIYSTENGSNYVKSLGIILIESLTKNMPKPIKLEWEIMGAGTSEQHYKKIMEIIDGGGGKKEKNKKVDVKKDESANITEKKMKIMKRLKMLGYDEERYMMIDISMMSESMPSVIDLLLGDIDKMFLDVEFRDKVDVVLKSETNRQALERMTVMPINLGNSVGMLPPLERQLIGNMQLRAELNAICPELSDKLPAGQFFLTKEVKKLIVNTCNLVCMNEKNINAEKLTVMSEIMMSLECEALECENSASSDNDSMIVIINRMMEMATEGNVLVARRFVPRGTLKLTGDF
jgi:hypothetical protein